MTQSGRGLKHFFSVTLYNFQKSVCVCGGGGGLLRVSVRRQVACYVTKRRTTGNTTDEFNSHTVNTVDLQNSMACPQQ